LYLKFAIESFEKKEGKKERKKNGIRFDREIQVDLETHSTVYLLVVCNKALSWRERRSTVVAVKLGQEAFYLCFWVLQFSTIQVGSE